MRPTLTQPALIIALFACVLVSPWHIAGAAESAVIFMYHHVAQDTPASTSTSPARFEEQLEWLEANEFNVVPLETTLAALRNGESVPANAVIITFDDAYTSVLTEAAPLLEARGWPYTIFVTTDYADGDYTGYLSWEALRTLAGRGATIGNHSKSHASFARRLDGESTSAWRARIAEEISGAADRLTAELGESVIDVLAYPYGEYDVEVKRIVAQQGLVALGQHSGAAGAGTDWLAVPRFPVASGYDALDDFALRARSRPLNIDLIGDEIHIVDGGRQAVEGVVKSKDVRRSELACFAGGQGRMTLQWIDAEAGHFVASPNASLPPGRTKYNCTAPSATHNGVYHWFSYLWMTRRSDGTWYDE